MKYHRLLLKLKVIFAIIPLVCIFSVAHASVTIRFGWETADSDLSPYAIMAHNFSEQLNKIAPGEFNVKFFPNGQLGSETGMVQQMEVGALDAGVIAGAKISPIIPAFQVNDLPFLYSSQKQAEKILKGKVGKALIKDLREKNIICFGFAVAGFRDVINNVRPIHTPRDMHGLKLRMQPNKLFLASFKALGASPVPMDWGDTYTAVQQHTIDGLEIPLAVIYANKYADITKYLSLTKHAFNAMPLLMSKAKYDQLTPKQRENVRMAAKKAIKEQHREVAHNRKKLIRLLKKAGMHVNKVSNLSAFKNKVKPIYKNYKSKIGSDLINEVLKETSKK